MKKLSWIAAAALVGFAGGCAGADYRRSAGADHQSDRSCSSFPGGIPSAQSKYAIPAQITSQMGYQKQSPITAFSYTFGNSQSLIVLTNSTTVAQGTITFAAAPSDGANECLYAQNIVTTLTSLRRPARRLTMP